MLGVVEGRRKQGSLQFSETPQVIPSPRTFRGYWHNCYSAKATQQNFKLFSLMQPYYLHIYRVGF